MACALAAAHGVAVAAAEPDPAEPEAPAPSVVRLRTAALVLGSVGGTLAYGHAKWWGDDGYSSHFHTVDEGWFGRGTDYGGADKLGHAMFSYTGTRLLTRGFEWAGHGRDDAVRLGAWTAVGTLLLVEVVDGYSKRWRFSKEDVVADLLGGAFGWWMERTPQVDALLDLRIQYRRSTAPDGTRRGFNPFGDYSGQRYLLVFKASGVPAWKHHPWLRYLEFSVGYSARNFEEDARALAAPTRQIHYGVSLNLTEVLRATVFSAQRRRAPVQQVTETLLEFVQVPAAATGTEHQID